MLTRKQHELLIFIDKHLRTTGFSPSFEEMKEALNLKSKSGIHRLITGLEERGFVRRLPHDLVAAFRSTLEEVRSASLLLHVVDSSRDDQRQLMLEQVNTVLHDIGAGDIPQIEVMNKIDLAGREPARSRGEAGGPERVWLSARSGAGLHLLRAAIGERFADALTHQHLRLPSCDGRLRAQVFSLGQVRHEQFDADGGWQVEFDIRRQDLGRLAPLLTAARPVEQ